MQREDCAAFLDLPKGSGFAGRLKAVTGRGSAGRYGVAGGMRRRESISKLKKSAKGSGSEVWLRSGLRPVVPERKQKRRKRALDGRTRVKD
jgi:hypothetical protein